MQKKIKQTISFSTYNEHTARRDFKLTQELKINLLANWEQKATVIKVHPEETTFLEELRQRADLYIRAWNEDELKFKFISLLIDRVKFDSYELEIAAFAERSIGIAIDTTEIKGKVDFMVANGIFAPEQPYFFLHEYKREQESSGDAVGQLLATMFVAQQLNKQPQKVSLFDKEQKKTKELPLYGVYVIGRFWFFVRLEGQKYYLSKAYDCVDKDDLQHIFKMLKAQREMIFELAKS